LFFEPVEFHPQLADLHEQVLIPPSLILDYDPTDVFEENYPQFFIEEKEPIRHAFAALNTRRNFIERRTTMTRQEDVGWRWIHFSKQLMGRKRTARDVHAFPN
jgi:hypothetical protein